MTEPDERKQQIVNLFGRTADVYDEVVPYFSVFGRRLVEHAAVSAGEVVLDVGAGRGAATFPAAEAGARVLATDLAPEMLERLGHDIEARGLADRVQVRLMDAEHPDVPDAAFDVVLASFVVFFLGDPVGALGRYLAALRPGGRVGVTLFAGLDENWSEANNVLREIASRGAPLPQPANEASPVGSPDTLRDALAGVGYIDVDVVVEPHDITFADVDTWLRWLGSSGMRFMLERVDDAGRAELRERAGAVFARFANADGSIPLRQPVAYAIATRPV